MRRSRTPTPGVCGRAGFAAMQQKGEAGGMRTRPLGGSDIMVSELGLGTQRWGGTDFNSPDEEMCHAMLDVATEAGVNLVDTAEQYPIPSGPGKPEGSTEKIITAIDSAPAGSKWAVGTELNLVKRLALNNPDKEIVYLDKTVCFCSTMNRIDLPHLVWALESLAAGHVVNQIDVDSDTEHWAKVALDRMLALAESQTLPLVLFAEGGGGRPGDVDIEHLVNSQLAIHTFRQMGRLSGRVPLVGVASGYCFAGNAALLGTCDAVIATASANIGMAGPAMIEGGGLGKVAPTAIGPTSEQSANGVVDLVAADDLEAVALAKRYLSYFQGALPPPADGAAFACVPGGYDG